MLNDDNKTFINRPNIKTKDEVVKGELDKIMTWV